MSTVRDGIEQAVLISIGAAALTRERADAAVAELVRRGQLSGEEGVHVVERLMAGVRGGQGTAAGLADRFEELVRRVLGESADVVERSEHDDLVARLDELTHRVMLLETRATEPAPRDDPTT